VLGSLLFGLQVVACSGAAPDFFSDASSRAPGMIANGPDAPTGSDATVEGDEGDSAIEGAAVEVDDADSADSAVDGRGGEFTADGGGEAGSDAKADACPPGTTNACGGCTTLANAVGTACGCGGKVACNGPDAVMCVGASAKNGCGGCSTLSNPPGGTCGTCGDGRWACSGTDTTTCQGASSRNVCGSCGGLYKTLHQNCDPEAPNAGCCGSWECAADKNDDWCKPSCNACNGCGSINGGTPGKACNVQGCAGVWTCSDGNNTVCETCGGNANACCGGTCCGSGYSCGTFDGVSACVKTCSDGVTTCPSPLTCSCEADGGSTSCSCL
jgi:hypothetical protein